MSDALATWRRKLEYLQQQEAITADSTQKFALREQIAEAMARIAQFEAADQHAVAAQNVFKADISRIVKYAPPELIGREKELKILSDAWQQAVDGEKKRPHVLTFVALGGEGKTSLVSKWAAELAHEDWPRCEAAFAWSFYSQGTSEKTQASSDSFLKEALLFFGDSDMANSPAGSFDKGRRLAQLIGERRALLILDGLEPLQYAPAVPTGGELKDQGVAALLKALAHKDDGLCVVTTRYSIPDLRNFWQTTAPELKLNSLSIAAGVSLLRKLEVKGTQKEFEQLVIAVRGHALTLNLLGSFLRDAHAGDIRKRDLVKLEEADAEEQSGHAFRVMDAYVKSFKSEGEKGMRALCTLRLLGLFDRPATVDCLNALWGGEEIGGLTGLLIRLTEAQRNITLKRLDDANLITVNRERLSGSLVSLDAHPLLREYFAKRVREDLPGAWRSAHRRLFEHLCRHQEGDEPTLEDLQPLYQAVAHGCQAGLQQQTYDDVYFGRIRKRNEFYSVRKLGAFGTDLGAMAFFFEQPWSLPSPELKESTQARLLNAAAAWLRALGRPEEALEPMRAGLRMGLEAKEWDAAAARAGNLSELELTLGEVAGALRDAEQAVMYADLSGDPFSRKTTRARVADALHQAGRWSEAETRFREAEQMLKEWQPVYPMLYSISGFQYCDLLLAAPERATWRQLQEPGDRIQDSEFMSACRTVSLRAGTALDIVMNGSRNLLDIALNDLTLVRAMFYEAILTDSLFTSKTENSKLKTHIDASVSGLRRSGQSDYVPCGFLTRAWLRFIDNEIVGAQADLDDALEIAGRGPMRLHMADIHLYRARLFHAVKPYPWDKNPDGTERGPKDDLKDARTLIEQCGYWRRKEELEDAEEAAKNW